MKRNLFNLTVSALFIAGTVAIGVLAFNKNSGVETKAYSAISAGSLPSTISLRDNTASEIRSYYSSLSSLTQSERQGDNLLKNLKTILSTNQKYYSYDLDSGKSNSIWCLYEIIDRDWTKSPASDIVNSSSSTYISGASLSGTTLSGYKYTKTNPFVHALYYDRDYENYMTAWYNHSPRTTQFVLEREHIWPKSHGFDSTTGLTDSNTGGARGDPMHLWAAEGYSNGIHSNYYYGNVDTTKQHTNCGEYELTTYTIYPTTEYAHHNYCGTSKSLGSGTVFEPQDSDKGDIARAIFYMAARYNNIGGGDSNCDVNNPNLYLNDVLNTSSGTSSSSTAYNYGLLHDLLEWHHSDPVDEFEIHRNNLCYNNYTNNRNPFIDFPEWADFIWGTPQSGMTYSSPTGYAQPSSDTINGYNSGSSSDSVTSVTVSPASLSLDLNGTTTGNVSATVNVTGNAATTYSWSSSNNSIATVNSNGVVTAHAVGTCNIIATATADNTKTGQCVVTVSDSSQSGGGSSNEYELYSGTLTEGDYVIYYNGKAMNTTVSSNRLQYSAVTPSEDVITTDDSSIVWHIAPSGNYWTIYNAAENKYAASNGTNNQAQMLADGTDDKAFWTCTSTTSSETYDFINKSSSRYLRNNGTYGFACYATSTGGALSLYKQSSGQPSGDPESISATVSKTYHPGDVITKSDITVKDNLNNTITDFTFGNNNYQFTYNDTYDGNDVKEKTFENSISYSTFTCDLTVNVSRNAPDTIATVDDVLTTEITGTNSSYTSWSGATASSDAVYAGQSMKNSNDAIQIRNQNPSGIVSTTSGGVLSKVTVSWDSGTANGRTLNIYGKNTSYSSSADLYNNNSKGTLLGTIAKGTSTELTISGTYEYIGLLASYPMYLSSITISYLGQDNATNVSNYIMYEDTDGQCTTKLDNAIKKLNTMSNSDKSSFQTSDNYVISTARERLNAWATHESKTISYSENIYKLVNNAKVINPIINNVEADSSINIIIIFSIISLTAVGGFVYYRQKKTK